MDMAAEDATDDNMNQRLAEAMEKLKGCRESVMFQHQASLPRLPIPKLKESLEDFQRIVEPLLSQADYEDVIKASESFLQVHLKLIL